MKRIPKKIIYGVVLIFIILILTITIVVFKQNVKNDLKETENTQQPNNDSKETENTQQPNKEEECCSCCGPEADICIDACCPCN